MKLLRIIVPFLFLLANVAVSATELIAVGSTAVDSSDITAPFSLSIKPTAGQNPAPSDVVFLLQLKTSGGSYTTVQNLNSSNVVALGMVETGATYRVERPTVASGNVAGMDYVVPVGGTTVVTCALCSTAAKQPALGTAGTASADVRSMAMMMGFSLSFGNADEGMGSPTVGAWLKYRR